MLIPILTGVMGAIQAAAGAAPVPVFIHSTQSRWVTPFQSVSRTEWLAGTNIWVKPPTITSA